MRKTTKKIKKIPKKVKKEILKIIKKFGNKITPKEDGWKKEEQNKTKDRKFSEEKQEDKELENILDNQPSRFNPENLAKTALEDIIPILKERGFQVSKQRRNILANEKKEEQEERVYELPKTINGVDKTQPKNYWEASDYLSSMNKSYELKQTTPDGSSEKFITQEQNKGSSAFQTSSILPLTSTTFQQSYETEQERKIRENKRRFT
ncbi:MAG: hypothetical protein AABX77_03390 [Nanoarchaeota archaeon]